MALTDDLRVVGDALSTADNSAGVPIASRETIVVMKRIAGRTQALAVASSVDREVLVDAVERVIPDRVEMLRRLWPSHEGTSST